MYSSYNSDMMSSGGDTDTDSDSNNNNNNNNNCNHTIMKILFKHIILYIIPYNVSCY